MFHILVIICSVNLYTTTLNKTWVSSYQCFSLQLLFLIILLLKMSFDFSSSLYLHLLPWKMRKILFHNFWNCFQQQWGEVYMPVFLESVQVLAYAQRSHDSNSEVKKLKFRFHNLFTVRFSTHYSMPVNVWLSCKPMRRPMSLWQGFSKNYRM